MDLIFSTTNKYKISSAKLALYKYGINIKGIDIDIDEIQSDDPEKIVRDKVKKCFEKINKPLIAMDSGLFIEGLKGFPGTMTKYVQDSIGVDGLIELTKSLKNKKAFVQRTIAYTDGLTTKIFSSRGYGQIIDEERGDNGFGYDLIFLVDGTKKTLAEMTDIEQVEAWGDGWDQLGKWISENYIEGF